jgi:hypothetical protein
MTPAPLARRTLLLGLFATVPASAAAQSDLLKKGLDALGSGQGGGAGGGLSEVQIGRGLKEALKVASERVVSQVGQPGGYLKDAAIHIPLPGYLSQARSVLRTVGASDLLDNLETELNRAAEAAAPEAERIFLDAIGQMTLGDAQQILNGPDDAATQYFKRTMSPDLRETFRPVVDDRLDQTGAMRTLDRTLARYADVPFAPSMADNAQRRLVDHGLDGALSGLFHYMAKEEARIRQSPAARTTDLLKEVFG